MEPNIEATTVPAMNINTTIDTKDQLMALRGTMQQLRDKMAETRIAFENVLTTVDSLCTTDTQHMKNPDTISIVFTNVENAFTHLDDHIEIANTRLVNYRVSAQDNVPHVVLTTIDRRKRLSAKKLAGGANKTQDTFLTNDKFAARALTLTIRDIVGSSVLGNALVHGIVRSHFKTETLTWEQKECLKYMMHLDDDELHQLESEYEPKHNAAVLNHTVTPDARVTPHSAAVKVGLNHMWRKCPRISLTTTKIMREIFWSALQAMTEKCKEERVTDCVEAFVVGTMLHEKMSYFRDGIFGGAPYRQPMDSNDWPDASPYE
jgi:hypothetical protein